MAHPAKARLMLAGIMHAHAAAAAAAAAAGTGGVIACARESSHLAAVGVAACGAEGSGAGSTAGAASREVAAEDIGKNLATPAGVHPAVFSGLDADFLCLRLKG